MRTDDLLKQIEIRVRVGNVNIPRHRNPIFSFFYLVISDLSPAFTVYVLGLVEQPKQQFEYRGIQLRNSDTYHVR